MLKTFAKGGVHPPENKLSAKIAIEELPLPDVVTIPVSQHIGAPAKVLVAKGDTVKVGQIIAEAGGFVSANIHSSVSGKVLKIENTMDPSGYKRPCVIIQREGDEWEESIVKDKTLNDKITLSQEEIVAKVKSMGIVGLGGATFPSHVKLSIPKGKTAEYLVINGVECEPYLTSDHRIMLECADEIFVGINILMIAIGVTKAIVGIENNKQDAIDLFTQKASKYPNIQVVPLKVQYPQGGEKQLIKAVINREVPSGGLPIDVGCVVHNVGTALSVYEAVQKNKPLFERVVTVTGKSLEKTANYKVRIGTPVGVLLEKAGGLPSDTGKVVMGGPMMGRTVSTIDTPVTKGTSGIMLLNEKESRREKMQNCIRCCKCVSVCPMGLEPFLLMTLSERSLFERMEGEKAMDCIECGSCNYICPSSRLLLDYIRLGKMNVSKIIRSRQS